MPELEPEQVYGAYWLSTGFERLLGDVPGYGKTGQAIRAAIDLGAERVVVACPAVARLNWERELRKWGWELPILRITDKADHALPDRYRPQAVIASYDGIAKSKRLRGALNAGMHDALILDEAHRLKGIDANRAKAVYGTQFDAQRCLAGKAMHRWLLTGSPFPNHIGELWTHLSALWPHLIMNSAGRVLSQEEFIERYCIVKRSQYGIKILGYRDREGLVRILDHIMLRRDEIKGLPDLVLRTDPILIEADDAELAALEAHPEFEELRMVLRSADARANDLDAVEDEFIHLATLRRLTGLLKARGTAELVLDELGPGDKIVLFAIHREVISELETHLVTLRPAVVHGGIPDGQRNAEIDRFNTADDCRVFIGQIEATKECVNLPAANRVRLVEQSWNPETNNQAIKRVHRRGNVRQVFADTVAIAGSIDELVSQVLMLKTRNVHELMREKYHHGH